MDVDAAKTVRQAQVGRDQAYAAHLNSVTLLKNEGSLPIGKEKVYIEAFHKDAEKADKITENVKKAATELGIEWVADYKEAEKAQLEVLLGNHKPVGRLPMTLPKNTAVIAVDEFGISISRNDVPGYDKDKYMREGMTYAYKDAAGNEYQLDFGLSD